MAEFNAERNKFVKLVEAKNATPMMILGAAVQLVINCGTLSQADLARNLMHQVNLQIARAREPAHD